MEISGFFLSRKLEACKIKEKGGDRPVNDLSKIGYTIKSIRKSKGMTLKQLSEQTGLSVSYLSNLERNACSPTLLNIQKICEVFGNSLGDMLERNAEERIIIRRQDRRVTVDENSNIKLEIVDFGEEDTSFMYMTVGPESTVQGLFWEHEFDEVGTVISGRLIIGLEDKEFELNEGDTILIKAHTRHCYYTGDEESVSFWARYWMK